MLTQEKKNAITRSFENSPKELVVKMYIESSDKFCDLIISEFINKDFESVEDIKKALANFIGYKQEDK
jgi:hypothetical protein